MSKHFVGIGFSTNAPKCKSMNGGRETIEHGGKTIILSACDKHGICEPARKICVGEGGRLRDCEDYRPDFGGEMEWFSTAQLARDSVKLAGMLPSDISAIAGIPRSGMIPASIIAALLHLPLCQVWPNGRIDRLASGSRGYLEKQGRTFVVDDTIYEGRTMKGIKAKVGSDALYGAVYVRPDRIGEVDLYARAVFRDTHLLEWNFFNAHSIQKAGVAFDFDGILCEEDGSHRPKYLPRAQPMRMIVTGRHEKHRDATEAWLRKWGASTERLVMNTDYDTNTDIARWKGEVYKHSHCAFFVESDAAQAEIIHRVSEKQVICPAAGKVWR